MRRTITLAIALLAFSGPALSAQAPEATARIEAAKQRAQAAGIPAALLERKVAEGRAKGVPADRIAAAVEQRLARLTRAREVMGRSVRQVAPSDLEAGADALQSGVSEAVLAAVAGKADAERRAVAIVALTELVRQGHASEHALARVERAMTGGTEALQNLPAQAAAARAQGPPSGAGRPDGVGRGAGAPGGPPKTVPGKRPENAGKGGKGGNPGGRP